jgi:hypothetical protein
MSSLADDIFTGTNGDSPRSWLWSVITGTPSIYNNTLRLLTANGDALRSTFWFIGDFEVQIDFDCTTDLATNSWGLDLVVRIDETHRGYFRAGYTGSAKIYQIGYVNGGSWSYSNYTRTQTPTGKLKISRSSNVFTASFWNGSSWTAEPTFNIGSAGNVVHIDLIAAKWDGNPSITGYFDNFLVNSGTPIFPSADLSESLQSLDSVIENMKFWSANIEDVLNVIDINGFWFDNLIEEILSFSDVKADDNLLTTFPLSLDSVSIIEALLIDVTPILIILESLNIDDWPLVGWVKTIAEAITTTDLVSVLTAILADEHLNLSSTLLSQWTGSRTIAETILFEDISVQIKILSDLIADVLTTVDASPVTLAIEVIEYLILVDTLLSPILATIAELIALTDEATKGWHFLIEEAISVVDALLHKLTTKPIITDVVSPIDISSNNLILRLQISDVVAAIEAISIQQYLNALVLDSLGLELGVVLDGEVWQCWVLTTKTFNPSVFSNFNFNSFFNFLGKSWGIKEDGLYSLEGTTDNGAKITPGVILGSSNFGIESEKYFRMAYFGIVGGSIPAIKITNEDGTYKIYAINTKGEAKLSRDIRGRYLTISISDFDSLDFTELIPVVLTR